MECLSIPTRLFHADLRRNVPFCKANLQQPWCRFPGGLICKDDHRTHRPRNENYQLYPSQHAMTPLKETNKCLFVPPCFCRTALPLFGRYFRVMS
jgi:hypothetical protein